MGVLHHLEEVMSLPPLSPRKSCRNVKTSPSPLMHWGETCTYLSKHCFCFCFYSPFTSKNEQPSFFFLFFLTWLFAFLCLKFDRDGCFCLFASVGLMLFAWGPPGSAVVRGVWVTLLMILKPGGWRSISLTPAFEDLWFRFDNALCVLL